MPREHKIGITLLILAIGLGGAFCFRRPDDTPAALPGLPGEDRINQQVAELRTRPLLPGIDIQDHPGMVSRPQADPLFQELANLPRPRPESSAPHQALPPIGLLSETTLPNPVTPAQADTPRRPQTTAPQAESQKKRSQQVAARQPTVHVVQPGETLSELAVKYYGSVGRYQEIYEANQDLLPSPNHLRPGMKLKIPGREPTVPAPQDLDEIKEAHLPGKVPAASAPVPANSPVVPVTGSPAARQADTAGEWTIIQEKPIQQTARETEAPPGSSTPLRTSSAEPAPTPRKKLFVPAGRTPFMQPGQYQRQ